MPKDHTGLYKVTNFKELIKDLQEILREVYGVDYEGNPKEDPDMYPDVWKALESIYVDFPNGVKKLFDEQSAKTLIKLKLQTIEQMNDRQDAAREAMGYDES